MIRPILVFAVTSKMIGVALWLLSHRTLAILSFFGPDPFVLYALCVPSAQGLVRVFTHFATERPAVWLTIDDGPDEHDTPRILDLLDQHQARATFFVIGEHAARWPHLITEIIRRGHQIAHHTHSHPAGTFWCATPRRLAAELDRTLEVLRDANIHPQLFRPPVGIKHLFLASALAARGLHCVGWSVRSGDCRTNSPERIVDAMTPHLRPGAIVLLHEGPSVRPAVRVTGIKLLLEAITARNLRCEVPDLSQLR